MDFGADFGDIFQQLMGMAHRVNASNVGEYEHRLNQLWANAVLNPGKMEDYQMELVAIKNSSVKVYRNGGGLHKIKILES